VIYPELEAAELMGRKAMFERRSIEENARKGIDPQLLERSLHCVEYVAQMVSAGLELVFKGGTACQLLVGEGIQRLSIDVDIAVECSGDELRAALGSISGRLGGRTYIPAEVPKKGLDAVPLLMFNISAPTYYPGQKRQTMIKLDAMLEAPKYATEFHRLSTFYYVSDVRVRTPTTGSMLGDKLSTLGPRTVGIPADRAVDNAKQFYDIGSLLTKPFDFADVKRAHRACFDDVARWRGLSVDYGDALLDLVEWCKVASAIQFPPPGTDSGKLGLIEGLSRGVEGFGGYIAKENALSKGRLRETASRAALLAKIISMNGEGGRLLDFVVNPSRFSRCIIDVFPEIADKVARVEKKERWHMHMNEFRNNPLAMAAWFGYWYPEDLQRILG